MQDASLAMLRGLASDRSLAMRSDNLSRKLEDEKMYASTGSTELEKR
ncbi:hypothetical protein CCHR01_02476 [Colletotrichum chrysophilum]|uniref:Uncharacterized protein n=1 Tax=Colletotrichum chrysophilum TaxID=1836956 RepID=A0AAD9AVP2_9PEZI|nr:hypothetical protein CCHR01_02476 [Colletotrichum chrysophilum]